MSYINGISLNIFGNQMDKFLIAWQYAVAT